MGQFTQVDVIKMLCIPQRFCFTLESPSPSLVPKPNLAYAHMHITHHHLFYLPYFQHCSSITYCCILSCSSLPFFLPVWGFLSFMCFPSLSLKPGKRRCCWYGGGAIELFPLRKRRHACTLEENIQVWHQAVQVSETQGKQFCYAQPPLP